jgi:LuxR family maltose regulon positive regulatory protein
VSLDAVLTELLNGITTLKDDTVLVLDDYHLIDNQSVHQTMTFLLEHLPQQLHLALLSRADPPFPLTRLRSRGELLELRMPELRFTQQEVEVFLLQKGLSLSETDMLTLADRSEGWVGGLQLAAISMRGRQELSGFVNTFAGSHRFIVDYLANEVLERQTPEVRKFLLETSILERLCGSLCDAVTGRGDGQQMLEGLEAANLFVIPLDDERRWYRYHHLFAEFLRTRLEQRRSDTADLHKRAALWLEQHGLLSDAVHHLRASLSYTEVARLVEQQLEWAMEHGQFHTLLQWLESIPETEARLRPRLCVFRALLLAWTGQLHEAESWLAVLEHNLDDLGKHEAESIRAEGSGVRAIIASITGDLTRTIELSEHALQRLSPESLVVRSVLAASLNRVYFLAGYPRKSSEILAEARPLAEAGGLPGFALLLHALEGHAQVALGQLGQAAWRYREVLRSIADSGEPYSAQASVAHLCLGAVLCEWNQLEDAADHLRQGLDLQRYQGNPHFFIEGSLALARVQQAQNDSQAAWQTLETAERIFQKTNHPQQSLILAARALLQLRQGQLDDSVRWSVTSGLSVDDTLVPAREFEYRVLARILIRQGEHASALRLLERLRADAEAQERLGSVIELLVLQSLAYQAKGDKARASSTLNRALALAEPEGFIRVFVDEGTRMMALLSRTLESFQQGSALAPSGISLSYLNALLVASGAVRTADASLSEPLSQRELEVLRLLARGLPNKSIARELDLTPGTVKWYINGLFSKLEVSSRTQAMARASSLGLV